MGLVTRTAPSMDSSTGAHGFVDPWTTLVGVMAAHLFAWWLALASCLVRLAHLVLVKAARFLVSLAYSAEVEGDGGLQ